MSAAEVSEWMAYYRVKVRRQEEARIKAETQAKADQMARKVTKGG